MTIFLYIYAVMGIIFLIYDIRKCFVRYKNEMNLYKRINYLKSQKGKIQ